MKNDMVYITKIIYKGDKVFSTKGPKPDAIAEDDFFPGDIGFVDNSIAYPVFYYDILLLLPGVKKSIKKESQCKKHKKRE